MTTIEADFYFSTEKTPMLLFAPVGVRYSSDPSPRSFENAVHALCLHGTRAFVSTKHADTIQRLDRSTWLDWCTGALASLDLDFAAEAGCTKRVVQVRYQAGEAGQHRIEIQATGFGIFGEGATTGLLSSFFVHYKCLTDRWRGHPSKQRRIEIATAEVRWGADKEASIKTQVDFALRAAHKALTQELEPRTDGPIQEHSAGDGLEGTLRPDYGALLHAKQIDPSVGQVFYDVPIDHISLTDAPGLTTMINRVDAGVEYAVSFDFTDRAAGDLMKRLPETIHGALEKAAQGSGGRECTVSISPSLRVNLEARLGPLQQSPTEVFAPLVVLRVF